MLKELFDKNKNIVINTDIDGVLSGLLLVKYYNCKIVGFTNSKDKVWLSEDADDLYGNVYIDMFVTDSNAICIDQHVVAVDQNHMDTIIRQKNKYSPQSEDPQNNRCFTTEGFKNKYPFGTFQFIIAQMEKEGISVSLPNLEDIVPDSEIKYGDLLNRPDDAMKTTLFAYKRNAEFWWKWLESKAPKGCISKLKSYLDSIANSSKNEKELEQIVDEIKKKTKNYFGKNFNCKTSDGGFKDITDSDNVILKNIEDYINAIGTILGLKNINLPRKYNAHIGTYCRTRWLDIFKPDFVNNYEVCGHKVFSYAFIYGPDNDSQTNFSFTIDMK